LSFNAHIQADQYKQAL